MVLVCKHCRFLPIIPAFIKVYVEGGHHEAHVEVNVLVACGWGSNDMLILSIASALGCSKASILAWRVA